MDSDLPERVLVICAHPDDVDFGAAGTIAYWTNAGVEVAYVIVTDGDAGGFDESMPREQMPRTRRNEQLSAADVVGVKSVEFLGYHDGQVVSDLKLRADLSREIRRARPERVLCPSPSRDFTRIPASHPDHLAVGEAAMAAIYPDARNPFAFPELLAEGFAAHIVHDVWLMGHPEQDQYVDITDFFSKKSAALRAHAGQLPDPDQTMQFVEGFCRENAKRAGLGEDRMAESFFSVRVP